MARAPLWVWVWVVAGLAPGAARASDGVLFVRPVIGDAEVTSHVDHQGADWVCGDRTRPGHTGTDFAPATAEGVLRVVAAAAGEVIAAHDGEDDGCTTGRCPGGDGLGNHVGIRHADGQQTWYGHLARRSVGVTVGDRVACATELGVVGSSGHSTGPHLHFEVRAGGQPVDPYAGPCSGRPTSLWTGQVDATGLPADECAAGALRAELGLPGGRAADPVSDGDSAGVPDVWSGDDLTWTVVFEGDVEAAEATITVDPPMSLHGGGPVSAPLAWDDEAGGGRVSVRIQVGDAAPAPRRARVHAAVGDAEVTTTIDVRSPFEFRWDEDDGGGLHGWRACQDGEAGPVRRATDGAGLVLSAGAGGVCAQSPPLPFGGLVGPAAHLDHPGDTKLTAAWRTAASGLHLRIEGPGPDDVRVSGVHIEGAGQAAGGPQSGCHQSGGLGLPILIRR